MIENIITTTILLALFLALRHIVDGKISARMQYAIWLLVALRLLLAWAPMPDSDFSVMNLFPDLQASSSEIKGSSSDLSSVKEEIQADTRSSRQQAKAVGTENGTGLQKEQAEAEGKGMQAISKEQTQKTEKAFHFDMEKVLLCIYGIGFCLLLVWMAAKNLKLWNGIRKCRILYEEEIPVLFLPGKLYLLEGLCSPFLFGRDIYISPEMLKDKQSLHHIIVHETCHWKQGDSVWAVLRNLCLVMYWYHPLVWYAVWLSGIDAELACDERAVAVLGEESRICYGETLLQLIKGQAYCRNLTELSTQMSGSERGIKKRIQRIAKKRKRLWGVVLFVLVAIAAIFVITFPDSKEKQQKPANADGKKWSLVKQEGFPCIVVDEKGNMIGTKRGELFTKMYFDYLATVNENDFVPYQIQSGAFSDCYNLKTLIVPEQSGSRSYINYVAKDAFKGCSRDLVVYCEKETYLWNRLKELHITVREYSNQMELSQLGENAVELAQIQKKYESEGSAAVSDQEMNQLYGEPFFTLTDAGEILYPPCWSLGEWTCRELLFPKEATTVKGTFSQYIMEEMSVTIPQQITEIGDSSFMHCSISKIEFETGSKLKRIGRNAFMEEAITEISLPEGLQSIDMYGFSWCNNLKEVTIPESVEVIGDFCFSLCSSLEKVTILNPNIRLEGDQIFDATIINKDLKEIPNKQLLICCQKGSNAEKYAKKQGLQVEYIK